MDTALKQRLWGAGVLASLAIIFLPMLLKGPDVRAPDAADVPLSMPAAPDQQFETRQLPLILPEATATREGVLGMQPATPAPAPVPEAANTAPTPDAAPFPPEASAPANPAAPAATPAPAPAPVAATAPAPEKAKPATAEKPAADATAAAGNYVVNVGSFSNLDNAKSLVARLRAAKLPVTTDSVKLGAASAMRIRVGPYSDRTTAEAARLRADGAVGGSSKVIALDASSPAGTAAPTVTKPAATKTATTAPSGTGSSNQAKPAASVGFAVQLSAPAAEADALALRDRARSLGFDTFIQRVDTEAGARFRVRVGPVADRDSATSLRDSLSSKLGMNGIVVANP